MPNKQKKKKKYRNLSPGLLALLTVAVDGEGRPGGGDLVVADLAVLGRAVLVSGLHLQDVVVNLALGH